MLRGGGSDYWRKTAMTSKRTQFNMDSQMLKKHKTLPGMCYIQTVCPLVFHPLSILMLPVFPFYLLSLVSRLVTRAMSFSLLSISVA